MSYRRHTFPQHADAAFPRERAAEKTDIPVCGVADHGGSPCVTDDVTSRRVTHIGGPRTVRSQ